MNSQRGVTLTSLAIYIIIIVIIMGILGVVSVNFQNSVKDINKKGSENIEIDKFNMYFLKEVKRTGNEILLITPTEIEFGTNNRYTFSGNSIYLNDNIKIAQDIRNCEFSQSSINGKIIITVKIQTENNEEKTIDYVLNEDNYEIGYENEDDYIYDKEKIMPNEYQQIEYVTFQNDAINGYNNCINTLIRFNNADKIEFTYKSVDKNINLMFIAGYYANSNDDIFLGIDSDFCPSYFTSITTTPSNLSRIQASDGTRRTIEVDFSTSRTSYISFGSWSDVNWSRTIDWYSFKIWKGNILLRNFVPCYRKSDNVVGMYDTVKGEFYTNSGTGQFLAGPNK